MEKGGVKPWQANKPREYGIATCLQLNRQVWTTQLYQEGEFKLSLLSVTFPQLEVSSFQVSLGVSSTRREGRGEKPELV